MTNLKSLVESGALIVGSLFVAGLLFEVLCRTVVDNGMHYHLEMWKYAVHLKEVSPDPAIGHQHIPSSNAILMGVDVQINSEGLRDDSGFNGDTDTPRILMLGDSVTFGWGISQSETIPQRLERVLSDSFETSVHVINAGVGNYNTSMEVAWFERDGLSYNPDLVVLNVFINDAEVQPPYDSVGWLERTLFSGVILFGARDTIRRTFFGGPDWKTYYRTLYEDRAPGWTRMKTSIARLAALCRDRGITLLLADYPELRQLSPYPFVDISAKIQAEAQRHGIPYVSLLPAVQNEPPDALWVTPPDPHPNAYAAGLMANTLAPVVLEALRGRGSDG